MILYKDEVCRYLSLPAIPKKIWDGKKSFAYGIATLALIDGGEAYAVVSFDAERDSEPIIKRVFGFEQFDHIKTIAIVPTYMDVDIDNMDLDDDSKEQARFLLEEAEEVAIDPSQMIQTSEYLFDNIHNDEEARAFIRAYNQKQKIKGGIPRTHDGLIMRLAVIHADLNKTKN